MEQILKQRKMKKVTILMIFLVFFISQLSTNAQKINPEQSGCSIDFLVKGTEVGYIEGDFSPALVANTGYIKQKYGWYLDGGDLISVSKKIYANKEGEYSLVVFGTTNEQYISKCSKVIKKEKDKSKISEIIKRRTTSQIISSSPFFADYNGESFVVRTEFSEEGSPTSFHVFNESGAMFLFDLVIPGSEGIFPRVLPEGKYFLFLDGKFAKEIEIRIE